MALTTDQKKKRLNNNGPVLLEDLSPFLMNEHILMQLVQGEPPILLPSQKSTIAYIHDPQARCSKFLEELQAGSLRMYNDFIILLRKNNQDDIANILAGTQGSDAACQPTASPETGTQGSDAACQPTASPESSKLDETQVKKFMRRHGSTVMKKLAPHIGPPLLRELVAGDALTEQDKNLIKNEVKDAEKVDKLLDLISDPDKFHNFRNVLKKREDDYIEKMILQG